MKDPIRLNLDLVLIFKKEYLNIDAAKNNKNVILMDIFKLKKIFRFNFDEIYAKDVLEHVGFPTAKKWISDWSKSTIVLILHLILLLSNNLEI